MKISVRTTHYTNDNSPQLRGYATVKFDDSYVLESVKIMERQDSNEIFIAVTDGSYKGPERKLCYQ